MGGVGGSFIDQGGAQGGIGGEALEDEQRIHIQQHREHQAEAEVYPRGLAFVPAADTSHRGVKPLAYFGLESRRIVACLMVEEEERLLQVAVWQALQRGPHVGQVGGQGSGSFQRQGVRPGAQGQPVAPGAQPVVKHCGARACGGDLGDEVLQGLGCGILGDLGQHGLHPAEHPGAELPIDLGIDIRQRLLQRRDCRSGLAEACGSFFQTRAQIRAIERLRQFFQQPGHRSDNRGQILRCGRQCRQPCLQLLHPLAGAGRHQAEGVKQSGGKHLGRDVRGAAAFPRRLACRCRACRWHRSASHQRMLQDRGLQPAHLLSGGIPRCQHGCEPFSQAARPQFQGIGHHLAGGRHQDAHQQKDKGHSDRCFQYR
ncbi:MAG: hypothetical protein B7Z37_01895 [Verrucomicrobia bacterium 12-59-8]|nr:MAG: hypothetical protein B7Z37_01895 [Verrucomicrobia bacterium 12-59-8]